MKTQETTKQQKIVIDEDQLREVLKSEIENALDFSWSGWRIPIYVADSGKVSAGNWLANNSYQPGVMELIGIEAWNIEWDIYADQLDCESEKDITEEDRKDIIEGEIDEAVDYYVNEIKDLIERGEYNPNYYDLPIEIDEFVCCDNYIRIPVMADEEGESEKIIKFLEYNDLRNDIKQMHESISYAFEDEEGDIVFVDDQNNYYK
jgi:hypothetical protein